jgi:hypothetical protein
MAPADVDPRFFAGRYRFVISPLHSSDDMTGHPDATLAIFGVLDTTNGILLNRDARTIGVEVGGVQGLVTGALTWKRHQVITVTVDIPGGSITIEGAQSGNGIYFGATDPLPEGTVYVGRRSDDTRFFWGRIGEPESVETGSFRIPTQKIVDYDDGDFSRAQAAFMFGASESVLLSVPANTLRREDRGDGFEAVPLFEGERENIILESGDMTDAAFNAGTMSVVLDAAGSAPDGAGQAARATSPAASGSAFISQAADGFGGGVNDVPRVVSCFIKRGPQGDTVGLRSASTPETEERPNTDWKRRYLLKTNAVGAGKIAIGNQSPVTASSALNDEHLYWGPQLEQFVSFPSSYIPTGAAPATRDADVLTFDPGIIPDQIRSGPAYTFAIFPSAPSDLMLGNGEGPYRILHFGENESDFLEITDAGIARVVSRNVEVVASVPLEWAENQPIRITLDPGAGRLAVLDAPIGSGEYLGLPWDWPDVTARVGGKLGGRARILRPNLGAV